MTEMQGGKALFEILRQEGVSVIFGNPGTTELPLMEALSEQDEVKYILALQESVVLTMADGYAQATATPTVVNLHAAPGLGNALGMLYNAKRSGSPLIVTAGQHDQRFSLTEPVLWDDLPTLARPFVKWAGEVTRTADLPRALHRAFKVAMTPPMGPVFLSIPVDVLTGTADLDLSHPTRIAPRLRGDRAAIEAAARLLAEAERPVLIAGDAISQSDALAEMVQLAELIGAPVYLEGAQNTTTFPASHPLYAGTMGRIAKALRRTLDKFDVLFSAGGDLFTLALPPEVEPFPSALKLVHLDNDPWEIGKNYAADVAILGDPKATLPEICAEIARLYAASGKGDMARQRGAALAAALPAAKRGAGLVVDDAAVDRKPIRPDDLIKVIISSLPEDTVIVEELISSRGNIRDLAMSLDRASYFGMRGGGIGWGMGAAVGIKLAQPERPLVALIGDGSALYTAQALWTAANQKLGAMVYLIFNNTSYRVLKQRQRDMRNSTNASDYFPAMDIIDPAVDYVSLARSYGVAAQRIDSLREVPAALEAALAADTPVLLEVMIERSL